MSWKNSRRLMAKFALAKRKRCESLLETLGSVKHLGNLSNSLPLRQADGLRYGFDHHACEARSNDSVLAPWCPTWATSCVKSGFTSLLSRNSQYRQRLRSTEEATAFDLGQRGFALERLEEKTCLNREVVQIVIFNHTLPRLLTEAQLFGLACERLILKTRFVGIKLRPSIDCHTYHL